MAIACLIAGVNLVLRARKARSRRWIVLDGSNVMYWRDRTPKVEPLREVVQALQARGYSPCVVFDANAGYLLAGQYQHDGALARSLGLPAQHVMVVGKGSQADPAILAAAADLGARVVTNDRYRDWADRHPEISRPGHLVRGGYKSGKLWLDL